MIHASYDRRKRPVNAMGFAPARMFTAWAAPPVMLAWARMPRVEAEPARRRGASGIENDVEPIVMFE